MAIGLGSNLGDRRAHLDHGWQRLAALLHAPTISSFHETDPVGVAGDQPRFLNAAAVGGTMLAPLDLLQALLDIERERGRERPRPGAARTLDLDLLLYGDRIVDVPGLAVPHPRFRERRFVLEPLAEVGPQLVDPVTGETVAALLERLRQGVRMPAD